MQKIKKPKKPKQRKKLLKIRIHEDGYYLFEERFSRRAHQYGIWRRYCHPGGIGNAYCGYGLNSSHMFYCINVFSYELDYIVQVEVYEHI